MVRLMQQKNGQFLLTIPEHIVNALGMEKGDNVDFDIDLKKRKVSIEKKE